MDYLNDETSNVYTETLKEQNKYIDHRLSNIKNRILNTSISFQGNTKEEIASFLNLGTAQNLVHQFFKQSIHACIHCKKGKHEVRQLERAHCNKDKLCRRELLLRALNNIYVNKETPIHSSDILIEFIKEHKTCPLYILCKPCHQAYDNI